MFKSSHTNFVVVDGIAASVAINVDRVTVGRVVNSNSDGVSVEFCVMNCAVTAVNSTATETIIKLVCTLYGYDDPF